MNNGQKKMDRRLVSLYADWEWLGQKCCTDITNLSWPTHTFHARLVREAPANSLVQSEVRSRTRSRPAALNSPFPHRWGVTRSFSGNALPQSKKKNNRVLSHTPQNSPRPSKCVVYVVMQWATSGKNVTAGTWKGVFQVNVCFFCVSTLANGCTSPLYCNLWIEHLPNAKSSDE